MSLCEHIDTFPCFGSSCSVRVTGDGVTRSAAQSVAFARRQLLAWHGRFSRFLPESELSRLNRDTRATVPASALMVELAAAVRRAGSMTAGLVDGTLLERVRSAGYRDSLEQGVALGPALALAPPRRPAGASPGASWALITSDREAGTVTRPAGVSIDSGGLAKGLFADVLARELEQHAAYVVSCAGDLALGGRRAPVRELKVESPFDGATIHAFEVARMGVATSGIGRRSWFDERGRPAHHLLDPATGRPAYTGIVQATALAPSALDAEIYAKAALLSGPERARAWLAHGGVLVFDDGSHEVLEAPAAITLGRSIGGSSQERADGEKTAPLSERSSAPPSPKAAASASVS